MTFPKARLVVSACLFIGWLGFLFALWWNARTVVLSKPQFLIAQAYVIVDVHDNAGVADPQVAVAEVLWTSTPQQQLKNLTIHELTSFDKTHGYRGAGKYLLPLNTHASGSWVLAPLPRVIYYPRQPPTHGTLEATGLFGTRAAWRLPYGDALHVKKEWEAAGYQNVSLKDEELRVYVWNADTKAQVNELIAAK